jgi:hypothetical protein
LSPSPALPAASCSVFQPQFFQEILKDIPPRDLRIIAGEDTPGAEEFPLRENGGFGGNGSYVDTGCDHVFLVYLVRLVCFVYLVYLVCLVLSQSGM